MSTEKANRVKSVSKTLQVFQNLVSFLKVLESGKIECFNTQVDESEGFKVSL